MSDEQYTEEQTFEEHQEEVQQETADALVGGAAQEVVDEVIEEVAEKETESDEEAPASVEEEAIAKLRRKLYMSPGDWYVIHTYSGHERKVKANLEQRITTQNMEDYIFAVEVPDEYVMEYRGNAKKRVRHVRIPGYAIVCMDFNEASYRVVKETPAVTGFVARHHLRARDAARARLRPGGEARAVTSRTRTWDQARNRVMIHFCVRRAHYAR